MQTRNQFSVWALFSSEQLSEPACTDHMIDIEHVYALRLKRKLKASERFYLE